RRVAIEECLLFILFELKFKVHHLGASQSHNQLKLND
ncbi:MAG: hypothetical protein ACI823_002615, partial [Chitinophagales bacterium]